MTYRRLMIEQDEIPIGDVTFWQEDMAIVIGEKQYRGQRIGRKVVQTLVERARQLGYEYVRVNEIYDFNIGSQTMFKAVGFQVYQSTENGNSYRLEL